MLAKLKNGLGGGIALRKRSRFSPSSPGFDSIPMNIFRRMIISDELVMMLLGLIDGSS